MATIGKNINLAIELLTRGELVAIPTETVYGLAGNALDKRAVLSIFEVKNRPAFDPLIIHTDCIEKVSTYVSDIPDQARQLAEAFWPGPLTLLLPKRSLIPDLVTSGLDTVAVRIPDHPIVTELLSALDFPLAAPSANPFGYISPTSAQHVDRQLGEKISYILDGGSCAVGLESTIVGFPDGVPMVYRLGGLAVEAIENVIGKVNTMVHSSSDPKAPGMLKSHYAPQKPFSLSRRGDFGTYSKLVGYLLFDTYLDDVDRHYQRILTETGDMKEAAHNLFKYLRELDALPVSEIKSEMAPEYGLGLAINDRLQRAAAV